MLNNTFNNETQFIFSNEFIGFTTIPNYIFQSKTLSFKAVGIYCSILQYQNSPNHKISIKGLMAIHSDKERSVTSGLNELLDAGFLTRKQIRENGKIKGYLYTVYMKPVENTSVTPKRHFVDMENVEMQNVVNKKETKKKQNIKKEYKTSLLETTIQDKAQDREEDIYLENVESIEKETRLALTPSQKSKVCKWVKERITKAIELFTTYGGTSFAYLQKCYDNPLVVASSVISAPVSKNSTFTSTYSHNWNIAELERREMEYVKQIYG